MSQPYKQNDKNFQPRVGFAYDLFGDGKTVVRGAYGLMTDQPVSGLVGGLSSNPPFGNPLNFVSTRARPTTTFSTLLADAGVSGLAPVAVDPNYNDSYVQQFNFNVQQQTGRAVVDDGGLLREQGDAPAHAGEREPVDQRGASVPDAVAGEPHRSGGDDRATSPTT